MHSNQTDNVEEVFGNFYVKVVRMAFKMMNTEYTFDEHYLQCIGSDPKHIEIAATEKTMVLPGLVRTLILF